jgi:hypothetical protein
MVKMPIKAPEPTHGTSCQHPHTGIQITKLIRLLAFFFVHPFAFFASLR